MQAVKVPDPGPEPEGPGGRAGRKRRIPL